MDEAGQEGPSTEKPHRRVSFKEYPMRCMDGLPTKLISCLAIGLGAFWLAAPPISSVDGAGLGGWWSIYENSAHDYLAMTGQPGSMMDFSSLQMQACEYYSGGSTNCWGGYLVVGVPSWSGRMQKGGSLIKDVCSGGCGHVHSDFVYEADWVYP
jgi:hypothetical protein